MSRQVVLNVEILSIKKSSQEQAGIDWNAVFNDGHLGLSLGGSFGNAAENVITSGVSIVDGKLAGSKAFLKALSSQGSVSVVTQNSAVTKNLTPVPMQIANQQGFIESVTTDSTANGIIHVTECGNNNDRIQYDSASIHSAGFTKPAIAVLNESV